MGLNEFMMTTYRYSTGAARRLVSTGSAIAGIEGRTVKANESPIPGSEV